MMRTMRENSKWIFYILAIAFVGWLVFGVGMDISGRQSGSGDVVLKVNGREVHLPEYDAARQAAYEEVRQRSHGTLSRDEEQQIDNEVVDQLVQEALLEQQYRRFGITVTNDEVIQAAQSSPPPDVMQAPEFQTNGQFDITKWQRYLASAPDPQFLQVLEGRYRQEIPQAKLAQYLTADVYLSDGKLWRMYRDRYEAVTVAVLALGPNDIPDADAPVSDAELTQYYEAHKADFKRPATAFLSYVAQSRLADAADSAVALARVRGLRAEIERGAKFDEVAKRESGDSGTAPKGGDLGWMTRNAPGFDPAFVAGLRGLRPGAVSEPVRSSFGYHLISITAAHGDSVRVRHILVPIEPQGKHLDYTESRADTLDKMAAEHPTGGVLDTVARQLHLPLLHAPALVQGHRLMLGTDEIPDVSVWAFEARAGETSPVIDARPAYYVFRLDSLIPAGTPPLAEIRGLVLDAARLVKKRDVLGRRAAEIARSLAGTGNLVAAAAAHGLVAQKFGPFTRLTPPPLLQSNPLAVGAAFGLAPGTRSGPIPGSTGYVIVETLSRTTADSAMWVKQKDAERENLLGPARQARIQAFLAALKARAHILDRRQELFTARSSGAS